MKETIKTMSNNKIYVGNLDYQMSDEDLKNEFSSYGEIQDVIVIKDHETGRSKGFGFVTFAEESALEKALELDGQEIKGRQLRVNKARPKQ
tara:strand:+ start:2437 stop:2709 length:273 start_codon:yes stop_codon:yes gene_type:complete